MNIVGSNFVRATTQTLRAIASVALIMSATSAMSSVHASEKTESFVRDMIDKSYRILNEETLSDMQRSKQFRELLNGASDLKRTAIFTLGPHVNDAEQTEIDGFVQAFKAHIARTFQAHLQDYADYTVMVTGSRDRAADDSVVTISISDPNSGNAPAARGAFRVRTNENSVLVITDIQMEGIWLAIHERSDFTSYLQRNGGNISTLSSFLNELAQNIQMAESGTS